MRLVDADEIIKETWRVVIMDETVSVISRKDIDNAPTVKAIPKEWIRDYMLRLPDGSKAYECILVMLEDWEKENGTEESVRNIGI